MISRRKSDETAASDEMTSSRWFSAKIRYAVMIEPKGATFLDDSIVLFRANNFRSAFQRVLKIGKEKERDYRNDDDALVSVRLKEVLTLDMLPSRRSLDGIEVFAGGGFGKCDGHISSSP